MVNSSAISSNRVRCIAARADITARRGGGVSHPLSYLIMTIIATYLAGKPAYVTRGNARASGVCMPFAARGDGDSGVPRSDGIAYSSNAGGA